MAGGIPLSAKFDVSIAEPFDSKLESVSTFSELASTPFPYKGMQKLVEDEGVNGVIYYLGKDLVTWTTSTDEDALKQGDNTLTEDLSINLNDKTFSLTNLKLVNILSSNNTGISIDTENEILSFGDNNGNGLFIESGFVSISNSSDSFIEFDGDSLNIATIHNFISLESDGISVNDSDNNIELRTRNGVFEIVDGNNNITILTSTGGLLLDADYSANYTNRSLVDKEYVDNTHSIGTTAKTPTSTGIVGQVSYNSGFKYTCVATNTWVREAVDTTW